MKTRINVPLTLSEPHFEDEATVVTARQVVPIEAARIQDRRRKILGILPILLAATVCGALGAIAVNFFEGRATAPAISQSSTAAAKNEQPTSAPAASPDNGAASVTEPRDEETNSSDVSGSALAAGSSTADSPRNDAGAKSEQAVASVKKPSADPRQLVRQRRVHPPNDQPPASQNDQPKSRGAGKIQDIFSGPNQ